MSPRRRKLPQLRLWGGVGTLVPEEGNREPRGGAGGHKLNQAAHRV